MFLKIKIRKYILDIYAAAKYGWEYKTYPLGEYIYKESVNKWLPILKKKFPNYSAEEYGYWIMEYTLKGCSPEKAKQDNWTGSAQDIVDEKYLKKIESLEPNKRVISWIQGTLHIYPNWMP